VAVHRFGDPQELAAAAAGDVAGRARAATGAGRRFRLGLSGGRTPAELYGRLARPDSGIDWSRVELLFADERGVPPTDPESNYWMARKALIEPAGIAPGRVHRMPAEREDLEEAARRYEPLLAEPLDLLILGVGEDGHVASLFPGSPLLEEGTRRVAVVLDGPKPPRRRLTLTPRAIAEALAVSVLATGAEKARAVARALQGEATPAEIPARLVRGRDWYLDRAAAAGLAGR
jgi:6-phosphogluconolactonase